MSENTITTYERLERQRILPSSEILPHEFLFQWHGVPCFARGELVAITGKAKSGKTYLNSILMAAAGMSQQDDSPSPKDTFLGLRRVREEPMKVLWIDTEQSEDSTHEILRDRIGAMIGEEPHPEQFFVYNLRQVNWQEREPLVEAAILLRQPDLVIFDGIRDVVGDINDYGEAQDVIGRMLKIASCTHACIVCVLHQNKAVEDKTLRGALGTELQNKSFETYECAKDPETRIFTIRQIATRKYDLPNKQQFTLSPEGLPVICHTPETEADSDTTRKSGEGFNPDYIGSDGKIDKQRLFGSVIADKSMDWYALRKQLMQTANIRSPQFADTLISEARDNGIIQSILINGRRAYMLQCQKQLFDEDT